MNEEDFFKRLKDCWAGKTFKGVLSRYYQTVGAVATDQPTALWANKMGSYTMRIDEDDGQSIVYTSYVVFESGYKRVHSKNRKTNKNNVRDEVLDGHLVEIRE